MRRIMVAVLAMAATPAGAQELREFCGDRPGLGTPACTVDAGHLQVELGLIDWTLDKQPDDRTDTILGPDVQMRLGIDDHTELRLGWTSVGHVRMRDAASGTVSRATRVGDVTVGLKHNFRDPAGEEGLSIAVLPFASLPAGRRPVGAGTWSAGLLLPVDYSLGSSLQLQFTPEVDAAADESGKGRHLAYSGVAGIDWEFAKDVEVDLEVQATRDRDPSGHATQLLAGLSFDYQPQPRVQLDVGANAGLNHNAPDVELYVGVSRKF